MTIVNSIGVANASSTTKENKANGLFFLKTSIGVFLFSILVFLFNLPEKHLYIQNVSGFTEYLANGYIATALYACLSIVVMGLFFVINKDVKWRCIALAQVIFAVLLHTLAVFLPSTDNQTQRFTQCANVLLNLDDKAKETAQLISKSWMEAKNKTAKNAQSRIKSCTYEMEQSTQRLAHKMVEISKPSTLVSLDQMQGKKIGGVVFSVAQEDKLVSCFEGLSKSGEYGQNMMKAMIDDLKRNGINQDPSFVINQCEGNLALVEVRLNGPNKLENYWGQGE